MVVDKYVGRCLDVGSTPTGSIIPLHSFAFLGKTLLNQRFLFLSLVFLCILLLKRESQTDPILKKDTTFVASKNNLFSTEDMGFEPTHAITRLPRFQHGLLSLLSNLPILTQIVYHKGSYLAIKILEIRKMIDFERK